MLSLNASRPQTGLSLNAPGLPVPIPPLLQLSGPSPLLQLSGPRTQTGPLGLEQMPYRLGAESPLGLEPMPYWWDAESPPVLSPNTSPPTAGRAAANATGPISSLLKSGVDIFSNAVSGAANNAGDWFKNLLTAKPADAIGGATATEDEPEVMYAPLPRRTNDLATSGLNMGNNIGNWLLGSYLTVPSQIHSGTGDAIGNQLNLNATRNMQLRQQAINDSNADADRALKSQLMTALIGAIGGGGGTGTGGSGGTAGAGGGANYMTGYRDIGTGQSAYLPGYGRGSVNVQPLSQETIDRAAAGMRRMPYTGGGSQADQAYRIDEMDRYPDPRSGQQPWGNPGPQPSTTATPPQENIYDIARRQAWAKTHPGVEYPAEIYKTPGRYHVPGVGNVSWEFRGTGGPAIASNPPPANSGGFTAPQFNPPPLPPRPASAVVGSSLRSGLTGQAGDEIAQANSDLFRDRAADNALNMRRTIGLANTNLTSGIQRGQAQQGLANADFLASLTGQQLDNDSRLRDNASRRKQILASLAGSIANSV